MTHKYKIGDWVRVVNMNGFYQIDDFEPQGMASITDENGNEWWPHPTYLAPAVMTLAEWDKLLPGGVMVGDVFQDKGPPVRITCRNEYLVHWRIPGRHGTLNIHNSQTFTLISRAKEPQMTPQYFHAMYAKPGDVVRCVYSEYGWWSVGEHYTVIASGGLLDDENESRDTPNDVPHDVRFIFASRASDTPLSLKAMTPDQAGPIMDAFHQGGVLEWFDGMFWVIWFAGKPLDRDVAYRLPPKPVATMNWTGIHPDITHVVMDENKRVLLCKGKPPMVGGYWGGVNHMLRIDNILSPCPFQANGAHWKDTLIERYREGGK